MSGHRSNRAAFEVARIFDYDGLCDRLAGKVDLVDQLIDLLLCEYPHQRESIARHIAAADGPSLREVAHRLKGQLQTLGVDRAAEEALLIEEMGRREDLTRATVALQALDAQMQCFAEVVTQRRNAGRIID
jgi:HPt (histidine-containing phosphotransfer) domain-containing protein